MKRTFPGQGIGWLTIAFAISGCASGADDTLGSGGTAPTGTPIGGASGISGGSSTGGTASGGSTASGGASNLGGASSGGSPGAGGNSFGGAGAGGAPGTSGDPCDDCVAAKCAAPIAACNANADCAALTKCIDACNEDPCVDNCYNSHPAAQALDDAIGDCIFTSCVAECQF